MTEERKIQLGVEVDATSSRAGFNQVRQEAHAMAGDVAKAAGTAGKAIDGIGNGGDAAARKVEDTARNMIASIQRTTALMEAGSRTSAQYYEVLAHQRGVDVSVLRPYLTQLEEVRVKQAAAAGALNAGASSLDKMGMSAAATAAAMRNVPAQFTDIITSLQGGQKPLTVFLQQGGQLKDMFGGAGNAAKALGGYVVGLINPLTITAVAMGSLAVAYSEGSSEALAYNRALILSGNAAGTTAGQLQDMANAISKSVGSQGAAAEALAALAGTGKVSAANLQQFSEIAIKGQRALGQSVADTAKEFADLAKSPVATLEKLSEKYPFLTRAIYDQVKALEDQGKASEAGEAAQKAYATAFETVASNVTANLGLMERSWISVKDTAKAAWDGMLNVGRSSTLADQLAKVQKDIRDAQSMSDHAIGSLVLKGKLPQNLELEQSLMRQIAGQEHIAKLKGDQQAFNEADLAWSKANEQFLTRAQRLELELSAARNTGIAAGVSDKDIKAREDSIRAKYADVNNAALASLEAQRKVEQAALKGSEADLADSFKRRLIGETAYFTQKRDLQLQEIDGEIALTKRKADIAGTKEDKSSQIALLADLKVLQMERVRIIKTADNEIAESGSMLSRAIDAQVKSWANATADEQAALVFELKYFGLSADARAIATAGIKIEAEERKFLDAQKAAGKVISDDELARLNAETRARKEAMAAAMGQAYAAAAATQLRQENLQFSVNQIADDQVRAARQLEIDANVWREKIANAGKGTEAEKKLQTEFDEWYANRQMAPVLDRWKGVISSLDHDFEAGFRNMLSGGKDAWSSFAKSIGDTLKTSLADAIYQTFVKKYVIQIVTSFAGGISGQPYANALSGQSGGTGGGAGGAIGAAQSASSLYSAYNSAGVSGVANSFFGSGVTGSLVGTSGAGLGPTVAGSSTGIGSAGPSSASGLGGGGAFMNYAAAIAIAMMVDSSLYGKGWNKANGANPNAAGQILNLGLPTEGAARILSPTGLVNFSDDIMQRLGLSDKNASILSGSSVIAKLFGNKNPEITKTSLAGSFGPEGFSGNTLADWFSKGGWFSSDKHGTQTGVIDKDTTDQLTAGFSAMKDAASGAAKVLGITADAIANKTYTIGFDFSRTGDAAADLAENNKRLALALTGVSDSMATSLVPGIAQLEKANETASVTLQRLSNEFTVTDKLATMLGLTSIQAFGAVGLGSTSARERLIDLSGGLDALGTKATFYSQNFLSQAQQIAPVIDSVATAMASLGLSGIKTADQFNTEIDRIKASGGFANEAGATEYAALMNLAPAFKQAADYTKSLQDATDAKAASDRAAADLLRQSIAKEQRGLNIQLLTAMGDAEGALAATRKDALDALLTDEARVTQSKIYAAEDAAAAIAKAKETAQAAQAALAAQQAAMTGFGNALADSMKNATAAAAALRDFNMQLLVGPMSSLSKQAQYDVAKQAFQSAKPENLQNAASTFLAASKALGGSRLSYARDFASVNNAISGAADSKDAFAASIPAFWQMVQKMGIGAHSLGGVASGWSLVGENGPELANFTQPARIYTSAQTQGMLRGGGGMSEATAQKLLTALERISDNTGDTVTHTKKSADTLFTVTKGGTSLRTVVV